MRLTADDVLASLPDLADLLREAVGEGAGLGFLPPLGAAEAEACWRQVAEEVRGGRRVALAAREGGRVVGSAQLDLCLRPNGLHRAEVQKVMVRSAHRRRGLGRALLREVDEAARAEGRTTLHLDTFADQPARRVYEACGWVHSGDIPRFARMADGSLGATSVYHKLL